MASFGSVSQTELGKRRQQLRRQRRLKLATVVWQTLAVSAMAGGLLWWIAQPAWLIARSEQVKVEGNQWLSEAAVRSLVPPACSPWCGLKFSQTIMRDVTLNWTGGAMKKAARRRLSWNW